MNIGLKSGPPGTVVITQGSDLIRSNAETFGGDIGLTSLSNDGRNSSTCNTNRGSRSGSQTGNKFKARLSAEDGAAGFST